MIIISTLFIWGMIGTIIFSSIHWCNLNLTWKQSVFLGIVSGPIIWIMTIIGLIGLQIISLIHWIGSFKIFKWFWNELLG